jgi:hypothetical protein
VLAHEPAPDPVPDIEIEATEHVAGARAEAVVSAPAAQDGIELLEATGQRTI